MPWIAGRLLVSCLLRIRNIAKPVPRINWNYLSSHGCVYLFPRASVVVVIIVVVVVVAAEGSLEFRSLEVKLRTIWTDEKQRCEESEKRREEKKKEDQIINGTDNPSCQLLPMITKQM